jgi:hypothetical protein
MRLAFSAFAMIGVLVEASRATVAFDALIALGSCALVLWGIFDLVPGGVLGLLLAFAGVSALGVSGRRLWRSSRRSPDPTRTETEGALAGAALLSTGLILTSGAFVLLLREFSLLNVAAAGIGISLALCRCSDHSCDPSVAVDL